MALKVFCLVLIVFVSNCSLLYAQKDPVKFGKVSDEEMKMTVYDKDTSASAVVITDYGLSEIKNEIGGTNFGLSFKRHVRIKILNKDGLDKANISISLYKGTGGNCEDLNSLKAQTYNLEDGKLMETKLSKRDLMTEEESENWIIKKFAFPNVRVGSVIEYEYLISSPYLFNFQDWYFQSDIPVIWSEYQTEIPEYFIYNQIVGGYVFPTVSEENFKQVEENIDNHVYVKQKNGLVRETVKTRLSYKAKVNRWVYKDVPAFKNEKYVTTPKDYLARIVFELSSIEIPNSPVQRFSTSWEEIGKKLMADDNFGGALNRHGMVKDLTDKINLTDSVEKKIESAYNLIRQNMKWDESYGLFIDKTLKSVSNKKQGSMAEINLLLVNLLRSVGIEAYPVLISSRFHGRVNKVYPRLNSFNTVIALAKVNGKNILMDATIAYLKPGQLTFNSINEQGLVVSDLGIAWVPLLGTEQYLTSNAVAVAIKDGSLSAKLVRSSKSLGALNKRQNINNLGKEKYIENYKKENSNWDISEYTIENEDNSNEPLLEKITINNFNNIDVGGDIIYLPSVLIDEVEENPFSSETREYPVDFGITSTKKYTLIISIPEGFAVDEIPKAIVLSLPENAATFSYQIQQLGQNIQIVCQLKITKTMFLPEEYHLLKEFYGHVIAKYGERIVLKKKV